MIVINFKNYIFGDDAIRLSKIIKKYLPNPILCVSAEDIQEVAQKTNLETFAQHADYQKKGPTTGFLVVEGLKESGASGTLLNHSEHPLLYKEIKETIRRCNKEKLKVILCASNMREVKMFLKMKYSPYAIAYEDPFLIGRGKSITEYKPDEIVIFVERMKKSKIIPLCGAGISNIKDVLSAFELGCKGVLISSAIANVSQRKARKLLQDISKIKIK